MSTEEIKAILCKSTALHMSEEDIVAILCNGLFPSQEGDEAKSTALDMSAEDIIALLCNSPLKEEDNAKELMESSVESCESTELATSDEEIVATLSDSPLSSREGDSGGELMVSLDSAVFDEDDDDDYDAEDDGVAFALEEFAFADAGKEDEEDKRPMKRPRVGEPEASSLLDLISPLEEGGDARDSMPSDVKVVIEDYDYVDDENDDGDAEDDAEDDNDDDSTPEGVSLAKLPGRKT